MNKYIKPIVAIASIVLYFILLRYVAPSNEPYFILGIGVVGCIAWLYGIAAGLVTALAIIPLTSFIYSHFSVSTSYNSFASSHAFIAMEILAAVMLGRLRAKTMALSRKETDLATGNENLQKALAKVQELGGVHSLCTTCKKIQDDNGAWKRIDTYLMEKTKAEFSHGICPDCADDFVKEQPPPATVNKPEL